MVLSVFEMLGLTKSTHLVFKDYSSGRLCCRPLGSQHVSCRPMIKRSLKRVCVYCGSSAGNDPVYVEYARKLGQELAKQGIALVFGGGSVGLMGEIADSVLDAGGKVFGVIPRKLQDLEVGHNSCTELFVVDGMHARKMMMAQLSDAFIAMPGGWGTLEELFEVTTWTQLNFHKKPVGILNVNGYYDHLLKWVAHAGEQGFIGPLHQNLVASSDSPSELLEMLTTADIPDLKRWLEKP